MKKILSIVLFVALSLPMLAGIHSYADQSVLANGHWVKIRVSETGVCRMSFQELQSAGLNPSQLRVYGYGGAMLQQSFLKPKIDDLPQVPVYIGSDYVLFYVQGPISWQYDGTRFVHTRNPYSNYGYYFLTDNVGSLLAPPEAAAVSGTPTDVTTYPMYQVHDYDSINLIDRNGVAGGGRTFYGEQFTTGTRRTFSFNTPNAIAGEPSSLCINVAATASAASQFTAVLNGGTSKSVYIAATKDIYEMACTGNIIYTSASAANRQQVQLTLSNTYPSALGWLNYIEITTPSNLHMTGSWMPIRTNVNYKTAYPVRFHLTNASSGLQVWDVTDKASIVRIPVTIENGEAVWVGTQTDGIHEYVAVNTNGTSSFVSATVVGAVSNQNLHRLSNIDYVIICPEGYEAEARRLAQAHEAKQGITWAVVTDKQVYNEFSSGTPDATAYRWLMKMLYDRADGVAIQKPRWLLLFGHGTFDNRKLLPNSGTALLLTYEAYNSEYEVKAYATDDYFGFLDDNEGETDTQGRLDIGVGRLPINDLEEANTTVTKLVRYINNEQTGKWKNQLMYLADDGEHGEHTKTAEKSAELVRVKNPDFIVHKVYLDAYPQEVNASGESYPLAKNRVSNLLKEGVLFFNYSGHGGYNAITNEGILNIKDIEKMRNANQAFWLFATCSFGHFDGGRRSSAETAVLNPAGGAISVLAATRTVYASPNTDLDRAVTDTLFGHSNPFHYDMTIGEAIAAGKNKLGYDANKLAYVLLGDPAIRLNYPTLYQVQTTTPIDTLHALSVQRVTGQIIDEDSLVVSDFNGKVDITVLDKMQVIKTRDNDSPAEEAEELEYNDYPGTIFSGTTAVKNGLFEFSFMVPKDIRYNYGNGRIVYYAQTTDSLVATEEAVGHFEQFIIGGTGDTWYTDTLGPQMTIYLNSKLFKDGDKTYSTPRFYADLYDEHGINTAGAGIGHDLMLIIDEDPTMVFNVNEYFTSKDDSYQEGQVNYLMSALADGAHSLRFRAWDLLNNSSTQTLNFIVEAGLDPSIYSVSTYPNPVSQSGLMNLVVNYDQPDELLTTEIYLFNMSGQMVWRHTQENPDQVTIPIALIGLQPGVYTYQVKIKSASSKYSKAAGKVIVTK